MLIITRLFFVWIVGFGLAGNSFASPLAVDLVYTSSQNKIAEIVVANEVNSSIGLPANLQNNLANVEHVKKKPGKVSKVAEPTSLILLGLGLLGLCFLRRKH